MGWVCCLDMERSAAGQSGGLRGRVPYERGDSEVEVALQRGEEGDKRSELDRRLIDVGTKNSFSFRSAGTTCTHTIRYHWLHYLGIMTQKNLVCSPQHHKPPT